MKKSRKGGSRQHLQKVGTKPSAAAEQHREREAVLDTMGIHERPGGGHGWVMWAAIVLIMIVAVAGTMSLALID
jgi:hypothetical protein